MYVLKRKSKNFEISSSNHISGGNFMQGIDCEACKRFPNPDSGKLVHVDFRFNTHPYFSESGLRKHFHASGMRAIDSPHDFTPL
jgi:hypothetical protein